MVSSGLLGFHLGKPYFLGRESGPLAAAQAYILQLDVQAPNLETWHFGSEEFTCRWRDAEFSRQLKSNLKHTLLKQRWMRMSTLFVSPEIVDGLDWTSQRALLIKKDKLRSSTVGLKAVWQGAILRADTGGLATCPLCKV